MAWRWTQHILIQLKEREIPKDLVEMTLANPDEKIKSKNDRLIYQKVFSGKLLRVVSEGDRLITVYMTNKITKYMKEGD